MLRMLTLSVIVALAASLSSRAEENGCNAEPGCAAGACPDGMCCPRCGCHEGLCPVCHPYCGTKTVTKYKYCCLCEDKCITCGCCTPVEGFFMHKCCDEGQCGCTSGCNSGCENGNCGCGEGCNHCRVREINKLVKIPYKVEVPTQKCWVEWVCPHCNCNCGCSENGCPCNEGGCAAPGCAAPSAAPATPAPPAPPAPMPAKSAAYGLPGGPQPAGANFAY